MTSSSTDLGAPPPARVAGLGRLAGWVEQIPDRVLVFSRFVVLAAATWRMTPGRYLPHRSGSIPAAPGESNSPGAPG